MLIFLFAIAMVMAMTDEPNAATTRVKFADFFVGETFQVGPGMMPNLKLADSLQALHGQTVEIIGFMDGILPRDGMHFMLIREPTTQCPFHASSFDWAAFVPIFLSKPTNYMDGPVKIVGRLDVGRKTDEMGLLSFVRFYDATISRLQ